MAEISTISGLVWFLKSNPTVKQLDDDNQIVVRKHIIATYSVLELCWFRLPATLCVYYPGQYTSLWYDI